MQIHVDQTPQVAVVRVAGDMRFWGHPELADQLRDALVGVCAQGTRRVVLSLLDADRIDSRGIGCLARCQAVAITMHAVLHMAVGPGLVKQALTPLNFGRIYAIFDSVEDAVKGFGPLPPGGSA